MESFTLWEEIQADHIVNSLLPNYFKSESNRKIPYMISITGIPGCGKTSSALLLKKAVEEKIKSSTELSNLGIQVLSLQMDGFHYYRSTLDILESWRLEILYRGAYWTFDSKKFYDRLLQLKDPEVAEILFPSFDHAVKDPEEDTVSVIKQKEGSVIPTVIIAEGLYLLLKSGEDLKDPCYIPDKESHLKNWAQVSNLFDYKIYIECDLDEAVQRVLIRNSAAIGYDFEFCKKRVQEVDRENGLVVMRGKEFADTIVEFQFDQNRV